MKKKIFVLLMISFVLINSIATFADDFSYTYTYDFWHDVQFSPNAYEAESILLGENLDIGEFNNPQGLNTTGNIAVIADTGNNRIVLVDCTDNSYELVEIVDKAILDGAETTFNAPTDAFLMENGDLYVCDTNNERILHLDSEKKVIKKIERPTDNSYEASHGFMVQKIAVHPTNGTIYVQVKNVNKGIIEFDQEGKFVGYVGASKVTPNMYEYMWKKISSAAQREQMQSFVPTEYNNVSLDSEHFIYVTSATFDASEFTSFDMVRRLNMMGNDILIRNGESKPCGDLYYDNTGDINGPSRFVDVVAFENDTYYCLDKVRGRIFAYDYQGHLLYAFGGVGNSIGTFTSGFSVALDKVEDNSLLALDSSKAVITRFNITPYGQLINDALGKYKEGDYDESAAIWEEVIRLNGNYDLGYIGIGRALLRKGEYKEAMEYFKLKHDTTNYSKAFLQYRKEAMEDIVPKLLPFVVAAILIPMIVKRINKVRKEIAEA